jgi:hypothetical protein
MLAYVLVAVVGILAGLCLGITSGFGMAMHAGIQAGVSRDFANPLLRFLARPTDNISAGFAFEFLLLASAWLVLFVGLFSIPFFVASWLKVSDDVLAWTVFPPLIAGFLPGRYMGRKLWEGVTRT